MSDLAITAATAITGADTASGDLFPVVDVSASTPKGRSITRDELGTAMVATSALTTVLNAKLDLAGGTMTGALVNSTNGAASTPALKFTGTPFTGGSATTTKPLALLETTGATSNNWSTSGTMLGLNAPSGFAGNVIDAQLNGLSGLKLNINATGNGKLFLGVRGSYISTQDDYATECIGYFGQVWKQNAAGVCLFGTQNGVLAGNNTLAFYNGTPTAKPTVSGSRGGNAALQSLCSALATLGLITDSTSA